MLWKSLKLKSHPADCGQCMQCMVGTFAEGWTKFIWIYLHKDYSCKYTHKHVRLFVLFALLSPSANSNELKQEIEKKHTKQLTSEASSDHFYELQCQSTNKSTIAISKVAATNAVGQPFGWFATFVSVSVWNLSNDWPCDALSDTHAFTHATRSIIANIRTI